MAKIMTDDKNYTAIADAINKKKGITEQYLPSEMAPAIESIPTGGGTCEPPYDVNTFWPLSFGMAGDPWDPRRQSGYLFKDDAELATVLKAGGDKHKYTSMKGMFKGQSNLTTIPVIDTANVEDISEMFSGCTALTELPMLDFSKVKKAERIFERVENPDLVIPAWHFENLENGQNMFQYCNLDASKITFGNNIINGNQMFYGYNGPALPAVDLSKTNSLSNLFSNCANITEINPNIKLTSNATAANGMFEGCTNLKTIPLLDTSKCTSMYGMFRNCKNLTTIPQLDTSSCTNMSGMFSGCENLTEIPNIDTSKCTDFNLTFSECSKLKKLPTLDFKSDTRGHILAYKDELPLITEIDFKNLDFNGNANGYIDFSLEGFPNLTKETLENFINNSLVQVRTTPNGYYRWLKLTPTQINLLGGKSAINRILIYKKWQLTDN